MLVRALRDAFLDPPIRRNSDAGNYYCEHVFFLAQQHAPASVVTDAVGDKLIGFLHLPNRTKFYTEQVVGTALRGYLNQIPHAPARVLLTGFGPFLRHATNPSGDFVSDPEAIDIAMRWAFPKAVRMGPGRYDVGGRIVHIAAEKLQADDTAIDGRSPRSIQRLMQAFQPHAVLSLGRGGDANTYVVEHRANSNDLALGPSPRRGKATGAVSVIDNYSLERALITLLLPRLP